MGEADGFNAQVAFTKSQLEILLLSCSEAGNKIGEAACKMALSSLKIIETQQNPPKRWEPRIEERENEQDEYLDSRNSQSLSRVAGRSGSGCS